MNPDQHYLTTVTSILETLQEEIGSPVCDSAKGYLEALTDLRYACKLGKVELESHLIIWCAFVPLNENDEGYVLACCDLAQVLSELSDSEEWSFE
jgi:hypothetical protein